MEDWKWFMEAMQAQIVDVVRRMKEITLVMQTPKQVLEAQAALLDELQEPVESIDIANGLNKELIASSQGQVYKQRFKKFRRMLYLTNNYLVGRTGRISCYDLSSYSPDCIAMAKILVGCFYGDPGPRS